MTDLLLTSSLGVCVSALTLLSVYSVILKSWRMIPAVWSQVCLFIYLYLFYFSRSIEYPLLLLMAMGLGVFSIIVFWPKMFKALHDHLAQWLLFVGCLILIIVNQVFWSSLELFILPVWACSFTLLVNQVLVHRDAQQSLLSVEQQLTKNELAIGLDLSSGLPNKLAFIDKVDKRLMIQSDMTMNLVVFKLTHFELLNSLIGHQNGDMVKIQMASRIRKILSQSSDIVLLSDQPDTAFLATLGGVDFCFAVNDDGQNYSTERLLNELQHVVNEPLLINATAVDVGIQFGVACYPEHGGHAQDLIEQAFLALNYHQDKGQSVYFQNKLEQRLHVNRAVISQLREDLNHNKFELFVQPQISLTNNQVEGGEVLIRWRRDDTGILDADKFISLAEESGVIYQLSVWSFEQTIKKLAEMAKLGNLQYLAVNVSNKELFQSQLVDTISNLLAKYEVEPNRLVVEIKESAFAIDQERALKMTRLISQLGVRIGLDEFGKDQSALSCFNKFTPWYVKVDCKSLNSHKSSDKTNTYLNAIIGLARNLKIKTIAHGIELGSTINQLKDIECDGAQGYFYSKPFELSGFDIWLEQWDRNSKLTPRAED